MRMFRSSVWMILFGSLSVAIFAAEPAAVEKKLTKLHEVLVKDVVEATPLLYRGRQLLFCSSRSITDPTKMVEHLSLRDMEDGHELASFGQGHSLGSAFVEGDTVHVFAAEATKSDWFHDIIHFSSTDLKTWKRGVGHSA